MGFEDLYEDEKFRDLLGMHQNEQNARRVNRSIKDANKKLEDVANLLKQQQSEQKRLNSLPQCPYCGGKLEGKYEICRNCGNRLGYVNGKACKFEEIEEKTQRLADARRAKELKLESDRETYGKLRYQKGAEEKFLCQKRECFVDGHGYDCIRFTCYCGTPRRTSCDNIGKTIECKYCGEVEVHGEDEYEAMLAKRRREQATPFISAIFFAIAGLMLLWFFNT